MTLLWYVMRSKPHKEDFLLEQLQARNLEAWCPRIRVQVVNPRARKVRPYFPGYLFIHLDQAVIDPFSLRYTPGASGLVSFGSEAALVPDELLKAIRHRVDEINLAGGERLDALKPGQEVLIESGPFAGYEGIFDTRLPGSDRVRVLLKLLRDRQLPLDLPAALVRPKKPRP